MKKKYKISVLIVVAVLLIAGAVVARSQEKFECPVTEQTDELPPEPHVASFTNRWYRSEDGELWASGWTWYAGGWKVGWRKPPDSKIEVSGRRLDGDAPALEAGLPDGYSGAFQASGLMFPIGGCWELEAKANDSTLIIVTFVHPQAYRQPPVSCENFRQVVNAADVIVVGEAEGSYVDALPGYGWQTMRVSDRWVGRSDIPERLEFLWNSDSDAAPSFEIGKSYLLFLSAHPGYHLQPLCLVAAEVMGDKVATPLYGDWITWLWEGDNLADIEAQVMDALEKE